MSVDFMAWLKSLMTGQLDPDKQSAPVEKPRLYWYAEIQKEAVRLMSLSPDFSLTLEYTRSGNGFLREMAVLALDANPGAKTLEAIIERLNDWVPAVRTAAKAQFSTYLKGDRVTYLILGLNQLVRLELRGRDDHKALLTQVGEVLALPAMREPVRQQFLLLQGAAARQVLQWMLVWPDTALSTTLALAVRSPDPVVRAMAYRKARDDDSAETIQLLAAGLDEPVPALRNLALTAWLEKKIDPSTAEEQLSRFTLCASASTRELAVWHAKKRGMDLDTLIADRLRMPPADARALAGLLGLCVLMRSMPALPLAVHSLESASAAVRKAAWQALVQLDVKEARLYTVQLLLDPSRKVFAAVLASVRADTALELELGELNRAISMSVVAKALQQVALLAALQAVWAQVSTLLECLSLAAPDDRIFLLGQLRRWSVRQQCSYMILPAESDLIRLNELLDQLSPEVFECVKRQKIPAFQQYLPRLAPF